MQSLPTDVRPVGCQLFFLPVATRVPLKFGRETLTELTCVRVALTVAGPKGHASGWGETPLSVQWAWPSSLSLHERGETMRAFCERLTDAWAAPTPDGHPIEIGHTFLERTLPSLLAGFNRERAGAEPMPHLAALICCSAFDIALHDAYGNLHGVDVYDTYSRDFMGADLSRYLEPAAGSNVSFRDRTPVDFLVRPGATRMPAWHLVGGLDPLEAGELTGQEPKDGYPVQLDEWIRRDGLTCLKVKLRGTDADWDYARLVKIGTLSRALGVLWLSTDFNCTVTDPAYVNNILDRLLREHPQVYQMILYVEQPFPYDLEANQIDVHSVSARKPLFMDESAHDWRLIRLGRELGWTGVALKTCKTQTGALLSLCWARAHGMTLMVQDLTNPMLAQIPHVRLAAHGQTIMGVETNSMQFYPEASAPEAVVHPGLYRRREGSLDLSTLKGPGFGYRAGEVKRPLPAPARTAGQTEEKGS